MKAIQELITNDDERMRLLRIVAELNLPECYIAAGFIRNVVWDALHGFESTELNDVDVIYFDASERIDPTLIQARLMSVHPGINWEVKNQAIMHRRNGDAPYSSSVHAMSFWPEIETAIGAQLNELGEVVIATPFKTHDWFAGNITHNPARQIHIFQERVASKGWLTQWPMLNVVN